MQPTACIALMLSLATVVTASPHPVAPSIIKRREEEVHIFRRDTPLTPNDLVIAENYGVNTTERTYALEKLKNSTLIKRRGEEEVTVWIDNSFEETLDLGENPAIPKRAVRIVDDYGRSNAWAEERCQRHTHEYNDNTGPNAPCTGGLKQLRTWARENNGVFRFEATGNPWRTLVVAGNDSGCNGRIRAQKVSTWGAPGNGIGNADIFYIVDGSLTRFTKVIDGRERMRSYGHPWCGFSHGAGMNWQVTDYDKKI